MLAGRDQQPPLGANATYRGIAMGSMVLDCIAEMAARPYSHSPYPEGAIVYVVFYAFDLNAYRYSVSSELRYLRDEQQGLDIEAETAKAQEELLVVVDSIMDQGGVL
jgi:hypothetical protein